MTIRRAGQVELPPKSPATTLLKARTDLLGGRSLARDLGTERAELVAVVTRDHGILMRGSAAAMSRMRTAPAFTHVPVESLKSRRRGVEDDSLRRVRRSANFTASPMR